jgi:hypothetical protein
LKETAAQTIVTVMMLVMLVNMRINWVMKNTVAMAPCYVEFLNRAGMAVMIAFLRASLAKQEGIAKTKQQPANYVEKGNMSPVLAHRVALLVRKDTSKLVRGKHHANLVTQVFALRGHI